MHESLLNNFLSCNFNSRFFLVCSSNLFYLNDIVALPFLAHKKFKLIWKQNVQNDCNVARNGLFLSKFYREFMLCWKINPLLIDISVQDNCLIIIELYGIGMNFNVGWFRKVQGSRILDGTLQIVLRGGGNRKIKFISCLFGRSFVVYGCLSTENRNFNWTSINFRYFFALQVVLSKSITSKPIFNQM